MKKEVYYLAASMHGMNGSRKTSRDGLAAKKKTKSSNELDVRK